MSRKVRFYTDEHVSRAVINGLRNRGADVLTTKEAGMLGADDVLEPDDMRNHVEFL